jgi:hypothetical protein
VVVMAPAVLLAHPIWVADEECAHAPLLAESKHPPGAFAVQVPDLAAFSGAHLAARGP